MISGGVKFPVKNTPKTCKQVLTLLLRRLLLRNTPTTRKRVVHLGEGVMLRPQTF